MISNKPKAYSYIRMSTEVQLRGDSKRRQEELSRDFAIEHDLELIEGFDLHDIGVSAFKGANVKGDGALGRFMDAVKSGRIERGSYLLVESLDRLSRQEIMKSLALFIEIIQGGIKLVTLADKQVYQDDVDFQQVLFSLVIMSRAFEESKMKSQRVAAAWKQKRKQAGEKIMTTRAPAWLIVKNDKTGFDVIPERVDIIKSIFQHCKNGLGNFVIAKELNATGVPPFGKSEKWNPSSIGKILANRALLGEYQPKSMNDGKWVEAGEPILGYFPKVIDQALFDQVQNIRAERQKSGGGRKGDHVANLFSGLAQCGECSGKLLYLNKGKHAYLTCENARNDRGCSSKSWRYVDFELSFLSFVTDLDYSSLESGEIGADQGQRHREELQALNGRASQLKSDSEKTYRLVLDGGESEFLAEKLAEFEKELALANNRKVELEQSLQDTNPSNSYKKLQNLANLLRISNESSFAVRAHAASLIKDQVSTLLLWRRGSGYNVESVIEELGNEIDDELAMHMRDHKKTDPHFGVMLKLSPKLLRIVYPDPKDPSKIIDGFKRDRPFVSMALGTHEIVPLLQLSVSLFDRNQKQY